MNKQRILSVIITLLVLTLTACGAAAGSSNNSPTTASPPMDGDFAEAEGGMVMPEEPAAAPGTDAAGGESAPTDDGSTASRTDGTIEEQGQNTQNVQTDARKIVYTASMVLEVDEPRRESQALYGLATRYGGFVSGGNVYEYSEDEDGNPIFRADMQLRVNADQFVLAQEELRGMANEIISEQVSTQDVTAEYTDVESRIRNLERLEAELQLLLSEARERSDNMDEVLNIYRELTNVREEIEVLQGRINVLSDLVGLATINVTLVAPEIAAQIQVVDETWDPGVTMREAMRAFTEDLQGIADDAIWFVFTGLPRLLILGVVLLVLYVIGRRIWKWAKPHLVSGGPTITPPPAS